MAEEEAGAAKNPKTAEETQVLDDEELTRIVGGTGLDGNNGNNGNNGNGNNGNSNQDPNVFSGTSRGPDWD